MFKFFKPKAPKAPHSELADRVEETFKEFKKAVKDWEDSGGYSIILKDETQEFLKMSFFKNLKLLEGWRYVSSGRV